MARHPSWGIRGQVWQPQTPPLRTSSSPGALRGLRGIVKAITIVSVVGRGRWPSPFMFRGCVFIIAHEVIADWGVTIRPPITVTTGRKGIRGHRCPVTGYATEMGIHVIV